MAVGMAVFMSYGPALAAGGSSFESLAGSSLRNTLENAKMQPREVGRVQGQATAITAAAKGNTGSVSADRSVYPVPAQGAAVTIHAQVNDPDYNLSGERIDHIASGSTGPVRIVVQRRGGTKELLWTAGGQTSGGKELGPMSETSRDSGIFEIAAVISAEMKLQADDVIVVEYADERDASGNSNTVADSSTLDTRSAALQSDKSVYIRGSDLILTLIEPDADKDNNKAEEISLKSVTWISDVGIFTLDHPAFDAEPKALQETGDSTGIFQAVIEIPAEIENKPVRPGEEIQLRYEDNDPSGSRRPGERRESVHLTVFASNFGASIDMDKSQYEATDRVMLTVFTPDFNIDSAKQDVIGDGHLSSFSIRSKAGVLKNYALRETTADSGVFTGEIQLSPKGASGGQGPNDGVLQVSSGGDSLAITFGNGTDTFKASASVYPSRLE